MSKECIFDVWYQSLTKEEKDNLYEDLKNKHKKDYILYNIRFNEVSIFSKDGSFKNDEQLDNEIENVNNKYDRIFDKFIKYYENEMKEKK